MQAKWSPLSKSLQEKELQRGGMITATVDSEVVFPEKA